MTEEIVGDEKQINSSIVENVTSSNNGQVQKCEPNILTQMLYPPKQPIVQTSVEKLAEKTLHKLACEFVTNLGRQFHEISPAIVLYVNMIRANEKKVAIRTVDALTSFYNEHFQDIIMANFDMFKSPIKIMCTTKAYIELDKMWNASSFETKTIIWDYINQCACLIDPRLNLEKLNANTRDKFGYMKDPEQVIAEIRNTPEGDLINEIMSELGGIEATNPVMAIMSLVQSGKLEKIQKLMTSGNVDYGRILQGATGMLQSLSKGIVTTPAPENKNSRRRGK